MEGMCFHRSCLIANQRNMKVGQAVKSVSVIDKGQSGRGAIFIPYFVVIQIFEVAKCLLFLYNNLNDTY